MSECSENVSVLGFACRPFKKVWGVYENGSENQVEINLETCFLMIAATKARIWGQRLSITGKSRILGPQTIAGFVNERQIAHLIGAQPV